MKNLIVGIDVSKNKLDVAYMTSENKKTKDVGQLDNKTKEISTLLKKLKQYQEKEKAEKLALILFHMKVVRLFLDEDVFLSKVTLQLDQSFT